MMPVAWGSFKSREFPQFSNVAYFQIYKWNPLVRYHYTDILPMTTRNIEELANTTNRGFKGYKLNGFIYGADYSLYKHNPEASHSFALVLHKDKMKVMDLMQHCRIATSTKKDFYWNSIKITFKSVEKY